MPFPGPRYVVTLALAQSNCFLLGDVKWEHESPIEYEMQCFLSSYLPSNKFLNEMSERGK